MSAGCETGSCKLSDSVWALMNGSKVHRLTFSRSLVEMLSKQTGYQAKRVGFVIGERLEPG